MYPLRAAPAVLVFSVAIAATGAAQAQTALERGEERLDQADFAGALSAFDEAERGDSLDREQLVHLYARRAITHLALGNTESMEADLRRLASLDPGHTFGPEARPELREGFERVSAAQGEPLRVELTTTQQPGAVRIEATVHGDTAHLAHRIRVGARRPGASWQVEEDGSLVLPATEGTVEHFAEVVGPGGAVVARDGSRDEPRTLTLQGSAAGGAPTAPLDGGDGDDSTALGLWIGGGALVVAAVVGIVLLVVLSGNDATQPDAPVVYE